MSNISQTVKIGNGAVAVTKNEDGSASIEVSDVQATKITVGCGPFPAELMLDALHILWPDRVKGPDVA